MLPEYNAANGHGVYLMPIRFTHTPIGDLAPLILSEGAAERTRS
jgi:hypothetical protein